MSYKSWLNDKTDTAKKQLAEAKKAIKIANFSHRLYDAIFAISENDKFSYQIATSFEFDRIMNCSEFPQSEKDTISPFINEYKKLSK